MSGRSPIKIFKLNVRRASGALFLATLLFCLNSVADVVDDPPESDSPEPAMMCPTTPKLVPIATEKASVGLMKNLAEHPESIRAVAGRMLKSAVENTEFLAPSACTDGCADNVKAEVVYEVQPIAFLPEDKQEQVCLDFEKSTAEAPMKFGPKTFPSVDELQTWINDLTRGKGDDGKKLYDACSANCSPRYTFFIEKNGEALTVNSDVLCGLARDKDEEFYDVSTKIRQTCLAK